MPARSRFVSSGSKSGRAGKRTTVPSKLSVLEVMAPQPPRGASSGIGPLRSGRRRGCDTPPAVALARLSARSTPASIRKREGQAPESSGVARIEHDKCADDTLDLIDDDRLVPLPHVLSLALLLVPVSSLEPATDLPWALIAFRPLLLEPLTLAAARPPAHPASRLGWPDRFIWQVEEGGLSAPVEN